MKTRTSLFFFTIIFYCCAAQAKLNTPAPVDFSLTQKNITKLELFKKDITRDSFNKFWGQFQLRIPQKLFIRQIENCPKNVFLRTSAVISSDPDTAEQLDTRWKLFQEILQVMDGKLDHVDVQIEFSIFSTVTKKGKIHMENCTAYISEKK